MNASIKDLVASCPSGLLKLQPSLSIPEYRENFGFNLKNIYTIYQSKKIYHKNEEWFAFPGKCLNNLFAVSEESAGDLLIVYIVETIKDGEIHCHLVLTNEAYQNILNDKSCHLLQVHQMYEQFFKDHIALNLAS